MVEWKKGAKEKINKIDTIYISKGGRWMKAHLYEWGKVLEVV